MIDVRKVDGVTVMQWNYGENRFNGDFMVELADTVDGLAAEGGPLVLTGSDRYFSTGLDLEWLSNAGDALNDAFHTFHRLLARIVSYPGATVAAINGHAFGAGAIIASACDYRIQRVDRGYFCLPEIDLGFAMSDPFDALLRAKLPAQGLLEALITGRRYSAEESLAAGFVQAVASEADLLGDAVAQVSGLVDKDAATTEKIKLVLYRDLLAVLAEHS